MQQHEQLYRFGEDGWRRGDVGRLVRLSGTHQRADGQTMNPTNSNRASSIEVMSSTKRENVYAVDIINPTWFESGSLTSHVLL